MQALSIQTAQGSAAVFLQELTCSCTCDIINQNIRRFQPRKRPAFLCRIQSGITEVNGMGRQASLTLDCSLYSDSIADIITAFNQIGWGYQGDIKKYLPLHDDDMFEWQAEAVTIEELLSIITNKQACGELCGVVLYDQNSDRGISLLAKDTKEIMLNIMINRKTICGGFTDISWYIEHIAARLEKTGCKVQFLEYSELI